MSTWSFSSSMSTWSFDCFVAAWRRGVTICSLFCPPTVRLAVVGDLVQLFAFMVRRSRSTLSSNLSMSLRLGSTRNASLTAWRSQPVTWKAQSGGASTTAVAGAGGKQAYGSGSPGGRVSVSSPGPSDILSSGGSWLAPAPPVPAAPCIRQQAGQEQES